MNKIRHGTLRLSSRLRLGCWGLRGTTGSSGSMRAHSPSSISHGLAAVFLVLAGSHPLRPLSTRTDTPSFSTARKPHFGRSPKFIRRPIPPPTRPPSYCSAVRYDPSFYDPPPAPYRYGRPAYSPRHHALPAG